MLRKRRKELTEEQALERMMALCSHSEQCSYEIQTKLRRLGVPAEVAQRVIEELRESKFIDDLRYAEAYSYTKMIANGWGRRKIRFGLIQKRISSENIDNALQSLNDMDYFDTLKRVAAGKARSIDLESGEERSKLFKSLYLRGFETDLIKKVISILLKESREDA